ncbi:hypothetical protein K502DRAFT_323487 [Neoconidiobolus thromboides FSU 785]|nr:hypothetical protein K502DRAFT_323487 [Neoconidiobolus thromboides FSU 785]
MNCDWRCQVQDKVFDIISSTVENNPHLNKDTKHELQNKKTKYFNEDTIYEYIGNDWMVAENIWNKESMGVIVEEDQVTTTTFYKGLQIDKVESKMSIKSGDDFQLFGTKAGVNLTFDQKWKRINDWWDETKLQDSSSFSCSTSRIDYNLSLWVREYYTQVKYRVNIKVLRLSKKGVKPIVFAGYKIFKERSMLLYEVFIIALAFLTPFILFFHI